MDEDDYGPEDYFQYAKPDEKQLTHARRQQALYDARMVKIEYRGIDDYIAAAKRIYQFIETGE